MFSLITAVSVLLTYPTVPLAAYGGISEQFKVKQGLEELETQKADVEDKESKNGGVLLNEQDLSSAASGSAATINKLPSSVKQATTHIATYVNRIPKVDGVTWNSSVTENMFQTPFETVEAEDINGNSYMVEVVPENLVYFIDSYNFDAGTTSAPYDAVKELVGDTLLNEVYDQKKTDDNTWGFIGEASGKGLSNDTEKANKNISGLYGKTNTSGVEISYAFLLPAGKYTITTAHYEWWGSQNRSMDLSLTTSSGTNKYATLPKQNEKQTQKKSYTFEVMTEQVVTFTATSTGEKAPAISWLAVVQDEDYSNVKAPERPVDQLPSGYDQPLEDHDSLELAEGAVSSLMTGYDTMIDVNIQWNNENKYHATVKDAANLFQKNEFTVLLDIKQNAPSGDTSKMDQRVALTIGNASNSLHLLTWSGKFGYGGHNSGVSSHLVDMAEITKGGWNALAMTYEEKNGGNGSVVIYVNGKKSAEVLDIGFKLSEMNDVSAMIARTFGTNYLQEGRYDNLVVFDRLLDESTLCAETAWRKWDKENPPLVNTALLEDAVKKAEALIAAQITSAGLESALKTAKDLLSRSDLTADNQKEIDAAVEQLNQEYEKLNPTDILIRGASVDAANLKKNGLTYKGFGMLNGNSTSNLLLDYKAEHPTEYWDMMEYLFGGEYPLFTHIKMEMGNDGNNSTGAEACTMRYPDESADASRSPGFVMAADAKKINPNVKISILRWELPKWVADAGFNEKKQTGWDAFYLWYKETIFDAYEKYGYIVDFINPDKNETGNPDKDFIKWFAKQIEQEKNFPSYMNKEAQDAYHNIRIIASDENKGLKIVPYMREDAELYDAVDIIGFHYRTSATDDYVRMADVDNKEVWYSEGCATFGYSELQETKRTEYGYENIGGYQSPLALMDSFITAFCSSRRTHYIFQPAIGSFYEGIQYGHKELLSARDPWSGYIHYDPALHMLEHFAKFAKLGWENEDNTDGIWMAVSQASKESFAGSENEHATSGINGNAGYLTLAAPDKSDFSVIFVNNTKNQKTFRIKTEDMKVQANTALHIWTTVSSTDYLKNTSNITPVNGSWIITLPAYSIVTATTLDVTVKDAPAEGIHNEDRTVLDTDATGRNLDTTDEFLYADNFDYKEESPMEQYHVNTGTTSVPYLKARGNEPRYLLDTHGAWIVEDGRLKQELGSSIAQWNGGEPATIVGDFRWMDYTAEVNVQIPNAESGVWAGLGIRTQTGMNWNQSGYTLRIDGAGNWELYRVGSKIESGSVTPSEDGSYQLALTGLGDMIMAVIDKEVVATYQDSSPMLSGRVKFSSTWNQVYFDDFVVKKVAGGIPYALSMIDGQDKSVVYTGDWTINNPGGGSADNWYRTVSEGQAGTSFEFTIDGDGFAVIGENDASVKLTIEVDGIEKETNVAVTATPKRYESYLMSGLGMGKHDIKITVLSGTLKIDALYALAEREAADENAIVKVLTKFPELTTILAEKGMENLPESVEVLTAGGATKTLPVNWENDTEKLLEHLFKETAIIGTLEGGVNAAGYPVKISVPVEVIPSGTVYFIDTVTGFSDQNRPSTTEPYDRISALLGGQLLNKVYDQLKEEGNTWGLVDKDAGTKGYDSTTDKTATGIYGANNKSGETLTYAFTLPVGAYTLYSEHREWWSQNRPMSASVTVDGKTWNTGTISLSGSSGDQLHTYDFVVEKEQVVTYTITATGSQAPVISWLAVCKQDPKELREQLKALIEETKKKLADAQAEGIEYAKIPLVLGQYTGAGAAPKDNLQDLDLAMKNGEALVTGNSIDAIALQTSIKEIEDIFKALRVLTEYTNIPGTVGSVINADTGLAMQAHGGSATVMKEGNGEGCVAFDLDGDGEITEGKIVYLWYGENKTNNTRPVDGVRCYVSTDLYNWVDRGNVLYLQNVILPIEESQDKAVTSKTGASGVGTTESYYAMQVSKTNLEQLKQWGKLEHAPEGISEEDFGNVKLFLRAYVTEFDKAPTGLFDTSWTAKTYDETVITASSFLYPDSQTQRTIQTTPLQLAFEGMYGGYCITERPKMVYNELTKKFIIVFHADGPLYNSKDLNTWVTGGLNGNCPASRYSRAMVGFAESDTPFGPFKVVNITRMNYDLSLNENRLGEARDMTIFVDQGVDSNQDGADDAYVVYSSEMNAKLYVSLLNKEYTAPIKEGDLAEQGTQAAYRIVADNSREAPAIMKYDGWYYLLTSGTDGWNSTEHVYYRSQSMFSGWEKVGNPAYQDTGKCFDTQVTYILPVDAESGKFIYMGDRWNGNNLSDSRTIWLPIQVGEDHTIRVLGEKNWTVDRLDALTPVQILTELPETIYTDGSNLPKVIKVIRNKETIDSAVVWDFDHVILGEGGMITGTLTDCDNAIITVHAFVAPKGLIYLANPSSDPMSEDFTKIVEWNKETLKGSGDGEYSEETGFGYIKTAGSVRNNNTDLYQSMRYAADGNSITYQFKMLEGSEAKQNRRYKVYLGMFDPSSWYGDHKGTRYADILINEQIIKEKYVYQNNTNDTLCFRDITPDENGMLTITIAKNTQSTKDIQVSFLMIELQKTDKTALEQAVADAEKLNEKNYTQASYQAMKKVLEAAKQVLADENASQEEVDAIKQQLDKAVEALETITEEVDKTALEQVIAEAEKLDKEIYTEASYQTLVKALNEAKAILTDKTATQVAVDKAIENLNNAIKELEKKPNQPEQPDQVDKIMLEQIIAEAEKLDKEVYTEASYQAVAEALNTAKTVLADQTATQAAVDKAKEDLENAIKALKKKPNQPNQPDQVDKTALEQVIAKAEKLDKEIYTEASYQTVIKALNAAKAVLADETAKQTEIDQVIKDLNDAIKALKKKPVSPDRPNRPDTDDDEDDSDEDDSFNNVEKPTESVSGISNVEAVVTPNGEANVTINANNLSQAILAAKNNALQKGVNVGNISIIINVTTKNNANVNKINVNLPKIVQNQVVENKISNLTIIVDQPDISIGLNLEAVTEIRRQANGDVNLIATRLNTPVMTEETKAIIGERPVFDIQITYNNHTKNITSFASGHVSIAIPYTRKKEEKAGGIYAIYVNEQGKGSYILGSSYDPNTRMLRFATNHFSVYGIGYQTPVTYQDLKNHWAKDDLEFALTRGLLLETEENIASPNAAITRGALVTALGNLSAINPKDYTKTPFTDVSAESSEAPYIAWAYEKGILSNINTISGQKFAPAQAVTRQELAVLLANYAKATGFTLPEVREKVIFTDNAAISNWAKQAVETLQIAGVLNGKSQNRFTPLEAATRAEFASTLRRYIELSIDTATAQGWTRNATGHWMYYKEGKKQIGWQMINGTYYFFNSDGVMHEGWKQNTQTQNWYYWTNEGIASGWRNIGGKWYYFGKDHIMYQDGFKEIEGKTYYFYKDGAMAANTKIDQVEVDENGVVKE